MVRVPAEAKDRLTEEARLNLSPLRYHATQFALIPHGDLWGVFVAYGAARTLCGIFTTDELLHFLAEDFNHHTKQAESHHRARLDAARFDAGTSPPMPTLKLDLDLDL